MHKPLFPSLASLIESAFLEDCVHEDITTLGCFPDDKIETADLLLKKDGVIAGLSFLPQIFSKRDPRIESSLHVTDGTFCKKGTPLGTFKGPIEALLSAERTALNLLQHLSGIATLTAACVAKAGSIKILDTRKTLPGYRELQKYAVRCGGGHNHRLHLADRILIKNNHLALLELTDAIFRCKERFPGRWIEVEIASPKDLPEVLSLGVDAVLLDNMSVSEIRQCVEIADKRVFLEASGGITLDSIEEYAKTGIDAISMGQLTHSAPALDIAFRVRSRYTDRSKQENHYETKTISV